MTTILLAMVGVLAVAAATASIVVVGIQGRGRLRAPRIADRMSRAAERLNGDEQTEGS